MNVSDDITNVVKTVLEITTKTHDIIPKGEYARLRAEVERLRDGHKDIASIDREWVDAQGGTDAAIDAVIGRSQQALQETGDEQEAFAPLSGRV